MPCVGHAAVVDEAEDGEEGVADARPTVGPVDTQCILRAGHLRFFLHFYQMKNAIPCIFYQVNWASGPGLLK